MNAIEKQLYEDIKEHPEDWGLRFDLAHRLQDRNEGALAVKVISEAPNVPDDEAEALQAIHFCAAEDVNASLAIARAYLENHPDSAEMHAACARLLCQRGKGEKASEHYRTALSLDGAMRDPELEEWFENSGIRLEITSEHGTPIPVEGTPDVHQEVKPISPGHISSLKERRIGKTGKTATAVPAPNLEVIATEAERIAHSVDHYAVDDLHPAQAKAVAPPPSIHAEPDDAAAIARAALERTGVVAARPMTWQDIKAIQGEHNETKEKISALTIAVIVHVAILFILTLIVIASPRQPAPEIVAVASASDEVVPEIEKKEVQKVSKPNPSSASRVNVLSVANTSEVSVPVVIDPIDTLEPIGAGNDFGMAMSFGAQGAGNVSFFGSQTKANKVVFVVDSSASMNSKGKTGLSKHQLMKTELSKTVKGLSGGVEFQIIFFSGPCWYVGDKAPNPKDKNDDWNEWVQDGKTLNFWQYKDGKDEQIPVGKYRQATPSMIRKTIKEIEETPATYGTDWRVPIKMAIAMDPDVIYFMTDGAVGKHPGKPPVIEELLKFNKKHSSAKINSICLMVPNAMDDMGELSSSTRGELTLVLEDGTAVRGRELEKMIPQKKKK